MLVVDKWQEAQFVWTQLKVVPIFGTQRRGEEPMKISQEQRPPSSLKKCVDDKVKSY